MRIRAEESAALIVDIQERLMPVIHEQDAVVKRCVVLIRGLKALGVPFVVPRQYPPRGWGMCCRRSAMPSVSTSPWTR